jgi:hypothetical protein
MSGLRGPKRHTTDPLRSEELLGVNAHERPIQSNLDECASSCFFAPAGLLRLSFPTSSFQRRPHSHALCQEKKKSNSRCRNTFEGLILFTTPLSNKLLEDERARNLPDAKHIEPAFGRLLHTLSGHMSSLRPSFVFFRIQYQYSWDPSTSRLGS